MSVGEELHLAPGPIPGLLEANIELAGTFGKRFVFEVDFDPKTNTRQIVRCFLEDAEIVDGMIVAKKKRTVHE